MPNHDMDIANQTFPAFRADLNDALKAVAGNFSGGTAPSPSFAGQFWFDTAAGVLKIRNSGNTGWINVGDSISAANLGLALLNSPPFVGSPTAPTPLVGENSNRIATTAYVKNQVQIEPVSGGVVLSYQGFRINAQSVVADSDGGGNITHVYPRAFNVQPATICGAASHLTGGEFYPLIWNPTTTGFSITAYNRGSSPPLSTPYLNARLHFNYIAIGTYTM